VKPFTNIDLNDFDYELPVEKIASYPLDRRDHSQLLIRQKDGAIGTDLFMNLHRYIHQGSCLFLNNSRVIPARIIFSNTTGASIELLCLSPTEPGDYQLAMLATTGCIWQCMIGNWRRFKGNYLEKTVCTGGSETVLRAEKIKSERDAIAIRFTWDNTSIGFGEILSAAGQTPLPPYIKRPAEPLDRERYQTIYSRIEGSVAAPTAGLHFTRSALDKLRSKNIKMLNVTLHVGAGTFQPIKTPKIYQHDMHSEFFSITGKSIEALLRAKGPLIAVGTTAARTVESVYWLGVKIHTNKSVQKNPLHLEQWEAYHLPNTISLNQSLESLLEWMNKNELKEVNGYTNLMIIPGYHFRVFDALLTNFHQPKSTLLLLIAAFIGDSWKQVYAYAMQHNFRFLSYGDSSLLFKPDRIF